MSTPFVPRVVFQPESYQGMQRGINQMVDAVRPSLGPLPRNVAIEHPLKHRAPRLLDDGAKISKALIELPDRTEDVGAMFVREVLWYVFEQVGDCTATAAVLLQKVYNEGIRYIAAGGNPMLLRNHLKEGSHIILTELNKMTVRLSGEEKLAKIAEAICHDPPVAKLLGEIFDIIGEYGRLEIRVGKSREMKRSYVEGMYWDSPLLSREMITIPEKLRTEIENAAILMTSYDLQSAEQLVPVIRVTKAAKIPALLVLATKFSDEVIALLLANSKTEEFRAIAVKTPGMGITKQAAALQDIEMLSGGRIFLNIAGQEDFEKITLSDLGRARRVWADQFHFGIIGGKGDPRTLRKHIAGLRAGFKRAEDMEGRQELQQRIGKLMGGSAILDVGGATNAEVRARKENAERAADAVRGAMLEGVVPGGGVALLACRTVLQQKLDQATDTDERAAYGILCSAVEEPFRTIVANAGHEPSTVLAKIGRPDSAGGFDAISGSVVDVLETGIVDSVTALKTAVSSAIASAALALTTDVLVHHKNPKPPAIMGPGPNWNNPRSA